MTNSAMHNIVMSIKPVYAERIACGDKRVEFRRRFSMQFTQYAAWMYISTPVREVRLMCRIGRIIQAPPKLLWRTYKECAGVSREAYQQYFAGCEVGSALELTEVALLDEPVSLARLADLGFRAPMSYRLIQGDEAWCKVLRNARRHEITKTFSAAVA